MAALIDYRFSRGRLITAHDCLKSFAVLTMVVDHIGYYFLPDEIWPRVVGRLSAPVWFFLIGHARRRDVGPALWLGGVLLVGGDMLVGQSVFALNVLFTILAARLLLKPAAAVADRGPAETLIVALAVAAAVSVSYQIVEYGALGLQIALYGHAVRRHSEGKVAGRWQIVLTGIAGASSYIAYNQLWFTFDTVPMMAFSAGIAAVVAGLAFFHGVDLPRLTARLPNSAGAALRFCGRHTLAIYVVHLLVFKAAALATEPQRFVWLGWKLYSMTGT